MRCYHAFLCIVLFLNNINRYNWKIRLDQFSTSNSGAVFRHRYKKRSAYAFFEPTICPMASCGMGMRTPVPMVPGQNFMRPFSCIRQQGHSIRSKGRQENGLLLKCVRSNPKNQRLRLGLGEDWVLLWIETSQAHKKKTMQQFIWQSHRTEV